MREEREGSDGDLALAAVQPAHANESWTGRRSSNAIPPGLLGGQRLLVERPGLEELLPARRLQRADVEIGAPEHLGCRVVENTRLPLALMMSVGVASLVANERATISQVRLLALHRAILRRSSSD